MSYQDLLLHIEQKKMLAMLSLIFWKRHGLSSLISLQKRSSKSSTNSFLCFQYLLPFSFPFFRWCHLGHLAPTCILFLGQIWTIITLVDWSLELHCTLMSSPVMNWRIMEIILWTWLWNYYLHARYVFIFGFRLTGSW